MTPHPHDPNCMNPGFPGTPAMNGQRLYMPSPSQGGVGPRMSPRGAPPGFASFGYFPLGHSESGPSTVTSAAAMCPSAVNVPGVFSASPPGAPTLLPPDQQTAIGRKNDAPNTTTVNNTTTKKKRAKTTKVSLPFAFLFHFLQDNLERVY